MSKILGLKLSFFGAAAGIVRSKLVRTAFSPHYVIKSALKWSNDTS